MSDPPTRHDSSLEMTAVMPRPLAPISIVPGPTAEHIRDVERVLQDGIPTLESCPACAGCHTCEGRHFVECEACGSHILPCPGSCATCPVCLAQHMLSADEAAAWRRENLFQPDPEAA